MGRVIIQGVYHYFLSPRYIKKRVLAQTFYDKIVFLDEYGRRLCECPRLSHANGATSVNWGEYLKLLSVKTGALEHCAIVDEFPETLRDFLFDSELKTKKNYLRIMHEVYIKSDFKTAVAFGTALAEDCVMEYEEMKARAVIA